MKNRKITMTLLLAQFFLTVANAQPAASVPVVDEYNALKSFAVLLLMIFALTVLYRSSRRKSVKKTDSPIVQSHISTDVPPVPDEVVAVITRVMHDMEEDVHDQDHTVLTIHKMPIHYSPWNSKIFGMRKIPVKK
ncbi:MAG: hypothetical protein LBS46_03020 [Dysgonamonadaceae bacterium]|jgi:hypothetical protein|nr:hypothetical protein [Dysgonamonadaceae bacterium]